MAESSRAVGEARALAATQGEAPEAPEGWESQLAALRAELETHMGESQSGVKKISGELEATLKEVKTLRDRVARAEKAAKAGGSAGSSSELASADLSRILKRLQGLETRQDEIEAKREKFTKDTLARLLNVEVGRDQAEQDRLASDESARARLSNIEERLSRMEGTPASQP